MKQRYRRVLCLLLCLLLLLPVWSLAVPGQMQAVPASGRVTADRAESDFAGDFGSRLSACFTNFWNQLKNLFSQIKQNLQVKREGVKNTMYTNAIHMLKSVEDTIADSFIITTEDGKVIVFDGGHRFETPYFLAYLRAVTGQKTPHIDAWFLSHPHDDHVQVFYEVVENHPHAVTFDKVLLNYAPVGFYAGVNDEESEHNVREYHRLRPLFADKEQILQESDVFNIGAAKFTVLYVFDPAFKACNDSSFIARMDLAGTSVMFTGDAAEKAGNKALQNWKDSGLLDCDICKMAHHGQDGCDRDFYEAVSPDVCLWPTPSWVWDNRNGNLKTLEVRAWMEELGVKKNYVAKDGSQVIRLMPRIVTTTDVFEDGYPAEKAIDRLSALGYDAIDMGFDYWVFEGSPFLGDAYLDWAKSLKAHADEKGIVYTHAHAPGEADAGDLIGRSIEAASVLGARYLVVHPIWHEKNGNTIHSRLRFLDVNARAIRKWLPKAKACGVVLLSENILWGASANPCVIAELVKAVNSPWFGWCFDVGHAWCSGYAPSVLKKCAVVPLSLHIQDNDGSGDGHLIPGDGTIDFDAFIDTLKEIGYLGDCVMEAHHQSLVAPDEERDAILARLLTVAKALRDQMI